LDFGAGFVDAAVAVAFAEVEACGPLIPGGVSVDEPGVGGSAVVEEDVADGVGAVGCYAVDLVAEAGGLRRVAVEDL